MHLISKTTVKQFAILYRRSSIARVGNVVTKYQPLLVDAKNDMVAAGPSRINSDVLCLHGYIEHSVADRFILDIGLATSTEVPFTESELATVEENNPKLYRRVALGIDVDTEPTHGYNEAGNAMSTKFATVTAATHSAAVIIWEEQADVLRVAGHAASIDEARGMGVADFWQFQVPTSLEPCDQFPARDAFTNSRYPVADADGAPLWPGAQVAVKLNRAVSGEITFNAIIRQINEVQQAILTADRNLPVRDNAGILVRESKETSFPYAEYHGEGALKGICTLNMASGYRTMHDVHAYRDRPFFVRLAQDPRDVCHKLELEISPKV